MHLPISYSRKIEQHSFKILIVIISLVYGYLMNLGIYGFGKDFHANYSSGNIFHGGYEDRIGWIIATLKIGNFHIGVFLTSFLLAYSTLKVVVHFTEQARKKRLDIFVFFLIAIIILHSWPIILSTSNAMRQGIMMSFLYLSLVSFDRKEHYKAVFFVLLMLLSHKSALLFFSMILSAVFFNRLITKQSNFIFYSVGVLAIFSFLLNYMPAIPGKIIGTDFSVVFLFIGLITLLNLKPRSKNSKSIISAYVYFFLLFSPVLYFGVANYQYERIWMVNIILVMLVISSRVKKSQATSLAILQFSSLLGLTFLMGVFRVGLT